MKQRLAIARAFLHDPPLLFLDEPYTGLDQQAAAMLDTVLWGVGMESCTIVLTTHDLERGLAVGQRLAILVKGKIVYQMGETDRDLERFREAYSTHTARDGMVE
jgi:ABC-type multidrug transport system ATPase subunit